MKLQVLTLGAKLYVSNSKQTRTLCQYILQLAKYDTNYDIRDRARFIKFMLFPTGEVLISFLRFYIFRVLPACGICKD